MTWERWTVCDIICETDILGQITNVGGIPDMSVVMVKCALLWLQISPMGSSETYHFDSEFGFGETEY